MDNRIREILINWGLQDNNIKQVYGTVWQAGNNYILKEYQDLEMLKRNLEIINILDKTDIPVGKVIPPVLENKNIQYIEYGGNFYFLSQKLPGCHLAFKKCEENRIFWNNSLLDEMNGWVKKNFEVNGWKYITNKEYGQTISKLVLYFESIDDVSCAEDAYRIYGFIKKHEKIIWESI